MRWPIFLLFCIMLVPLAYAGDVAITFKDRDVTLTNSIAYVSIDGIDIIDYVPKDGVLVMDLERGEHRVQALLDDPATQGNDYAGSFTIVQKDFVESDIVLSAVGSVRGFVVDEFDNMLPFANISISCTTPPALSLPETTNAFGAFFIKAAPVGSCRILASHAGRTGYMDIEIKKGDLADVTLRVVPPKKEMDMATLFLIVLAGGVLLFVVLRAINGAAVKKGIAHWQRRKHTEKEWKAEQEKDGQRSDLKKRLAAEVGMTGRSKDILETLAKEERHIVEYLLSHKGVSAQAILRHELGIARTTLGRLLSRLERKNIIITEKHGKSVRVQLTDWFLGRE